MERVLRNRLCLVVITVFMCSVHAQNSHVTFTVSEERPRDTYIGNVSSDPQFVAQIPRVEYGYIRYGFLKQTPVQALMTLNENTGVLYTSTVIDRESPDVCLSQVTCLLEFSVAVRSARPQSSFFALIDVTVVVEDINDNQPRFPHNILHLEVSESATVGTSFHIESAVDLDSGNFSVQTYEIGRQDGNFGLNVIKKLDGSFTVKLVLQAQLDRETKDRYSVIIYAWDGGNPRKFGTLSVNISVTDVNDNAPVFVENGYNITLRENQTLGISFMRISALDKDIGENGRVSYRFSQNQYDARVNQFFLVNENTGDLQLRNRLVYDNQDYTIIAEAVDHGSQPHVTQVRINVKVVDVGNNPPVIEINLLGLENSGRVNISEAASPGTFVAHINVIDKDTGDNGQVECSITDNKFELQKMGAKGYKVVVKEALDRELQDIHQIVVRCHDFGLKPLSASSSFLVSLDDVNDCAPKFTHPVFTGSIPENMHDFRTFVQVSAYDDDLGQNGNVRYYIDEYSTNKKFWIDEMDGSLRADQVFDRETDPMIIFKVIARDMGNASLFNSATVKVTITDQNDNAPIILQPLKFNIAENQNSGSYVGMLRATDADIDDNARTMFLMQPEYKDKVPFNVFPDGTIQTDRELDREVQSNYQFSVVVVDHGIPRMTSTAMVTVYVNDTNDNPPTFKFPKGKNNTAVVYDDVSAGHKVAQIEAEDPDVETNTIVSYDITEGNSEDLFVVDDKGGIYITRKVSITQNKTVTLKIAVKDGGQPQHIAESDLNIVLVRALNSSSSLHGGETSGNTIIVVIVVALTAVLSVIMIIVICFLRRFDHRSKARRNMDTVAPDDKYPKCYMDDPSRYLDNGTGSNDHLTLTYDPLTPMSGPRKKEVSFDIDDQLDHCDLRSHNNTTMSTFSVPESEKVTLMYFDGKTINVVIVLKMLNL